MTTLKEVLASAGSVTAAAANAPTPMVGERYPTDLLWALVARAATSIEDAKLYPGRDPNGNQLAFISNRVPGRKSPAGAPPAQQVTVYRQGSVTFNGVATIDASTLSEAEEAAGQLMAADSGMLKLDDKERKALIKVIDDAEASE